MGGATAQMIALHDLPEISALVLIGTGAKLRVSPAILDQILPNYEQAVITMNQFTWAASTPPDMVAHGQEMLAETNPRVMHNDLSACDQFDIRSKLAQIECPTLVIASSEDKLTPAKHGRFLADHIPQAQFVLLENAGHMMMLEKPRETIEAVSNFLAAK